MATYYVSNSASNGYQVGDNANTTAQAQSKSTPWLTLVGANTKATHGDTIIVNSGTYPEAELSTFGIVFTKGANWISDGGYVTIAKSGLTVAPAAFNHGANSISLAGFVFDGLGGSTEAIDFYNNLLSINFVDCKFLNTTRSYFRSIATTTTLVFDNCVFDGSTGSIPFYGACPNVTIKNSSIEPTNGSSKSLVSTFATTNNFILESNTIKINSSASFAAIRFLIS